MIKNIRKYYIIFFSNLDIAIRAHKNVRTMCIVYENYNGELYQLQKRIEIT